MKPRRHTNMGGFTLLEVLISTVLLSSVFVAVVALSSQSLRNLNHMQPHETAMVHAQEKLNQLLLLEELTPGASSGTWDDGYRWEVQISPNFYSPKSGPNDFALLDIHVAVFWGDAPGDRSYVLETTQWTKKVTPNARR